MSTNKYDYLDELDEYLDGITDADISRGLANLRKVDDPVWLEKVRRNNANNIDNPDFSAACKAAYATEEGRAKSREGAQKRENDPEFRKRRDTARDAVMKTDEYKRARANGIQRSKNNPEHQKNRILSNKDPEKRKKHSATVTGTGHSQFKGYIIGTDIKTGEVVHKFAGAKEIKDAGFCYSHVCNCVNGKLKQHKGYTWRREIV